MSYIANILRYKPTFDIVVEGNQCDSPRISDGFISPFLCYWLVFLSINHEVVFKDLVWVDEGKRLLGLLTVCRHDMLGPTGVVAETLKSDWWH